LRSHLIVWLLWALGPTGDDNCIDNTGSFRALWRLRVPGGLRAQPSASWQITPVLEIVAHVRAGRQQLEMLICIHGSIDFLPYRSIGHSLRRFIVKSIVMMALVGLVATGTGASAQSQSEQGTQGNREDTLEQCMSRQKASNSGLTQLQMETTCRNEMKADKSHKTGNDLASGPQADGKQSQSDQH
jgi:hypothetical protein